MLGSCWARSVVKTLAEDGDIGERPAEGGEKQAKAPRSLESIGGRHWASPEERRRGAGRKDGWESLALWAWGCPQTLTMVISAYWPICIWGEEREQ